MDINELEALLKEIEERSEPNELSVIVEGSSESDGRLKISKTINTKEILHINRQRDSSDIIELNLLDINLNEIVISDEYIQDKVDAAFSSGKQAGELPGVNVRQYLDSALYEVVEDYDYVTNIALYNSEKLQDHIITAPKGFVYDRASIPRIFWVMIDKDSLSGVPPLFHDLLYRNGGVLSENQVNPWRTFSRYEADNLFDELMEKSGVGYIRRSLAYKAVRYLGGFAWQTRITPPH